MNLEEFYSLYEKSTEAIKDAKKTIIDDKDFLFIEALIKLEDTIRRK